MNLHRQQAPICLSNQHESALQQAACSKHQSGSAASTNLAQQQAPIWLSNQHESALAASTNVPPTSLVSNGHCRRSKHESALAISASPSVILIAGDLEMKEIPARVDSLD